MQFRTRTLLVLLATSAFALTISAGRSIELRIALNVAVLGIWLSLALLSHALRVKTRRPRDTAVIWVGLLLAALTISATAVLGGLTLRQHWFD